MGAETELPVGVNPTHIFQYFLPTIIKSYCTFRTTTKINFAYVDYTYNPAPSTT